MNRKWIIVYRDQLQPNIWKRPITQTTFIRLTEAGFDVKFNFLSRNCNLRTIGLLNACKCQKANSKSQINSNESNSKNQTLIYPPRIYLLIRKTTPEKKNPAQCRALKLLEISSGKKKSRVDGLTLPRKNKETSSSRKSKYTRYTRA
jgi:hypothetical protein